MRELYTKGESKCREGNRLVVSAQSALGWWYKPALVRFKGASGMIVLEDACSHGRHIVHYVLPFRVVRFQDESADYPDFWKFEVGAPVVLEYDMAYDEDRKIEDLAVPDFLVVREGSSRSVNQGVDLSRGLMHPGSFPYVEILAHELMIEPCPVPDEAETWGWQTPDFLSVLVTLQEIQGVNDHIDALVHGA